MYYVLVGICPDPGSLVWPTAVIRGDLIYEDGSCSRVCRSMHMNDRYLKKKEAPSGVPKKKGKRKRREGRNPRNAWHVNVGCVSDPLVNLATLIRTTPHPDNGMPASPHIPYHDTQGFLRWLSNQI